MRRFSPLFLLLIAVLFTGAAFAQTTPITMLDGVTSTGASSAYAFRSAGAQFHVYSSAGSSATVTVRCGYTSSGPWVVLATVTNPSATGEVWQGTACPYMSANVSARVSGTLYAKAIPLSTNPGTWAQAVSAASSTPTHGFLKYQWTNSTITAGAGGTSLNVTAGTLPAKSRVIATYITVDGQATFAAGTLTGSLGVVGTGYADWIVASDLKAAAATLYGDATAERGAANLDGQLYYSTAKTIYFQVLAGAGDLANVTGSSGTITVEYVTYP